MITVNFEDDVIKNLSSQNPHIEFLKDIDSLIVEKQFTYIVLLNDVIEHINNHNEFIAKIKTDIINKSQKSFIYITVPAYNFLFSKHDVDLGHYRRYKIKELVLYNDILKMKIIKSGYFFTILFFIRLLNKSFSSKNKYKIGTDKVGVSSWNHNLFVTKIITIVLIIDYYISKLFSRIKVNLPGLSTYIIFEK